MRNRAASAILSALVVTTALSGCTFSAVQANQKVYDPSDGIGENIGDVAVRNAILVTEDGETANLVVNIVNDGVTNVSLAVSWETEGGRVERNVYLKAGGTLAFGEPTNQIILTGLDAQPGSLFPVYFQYGDIEGRDVSVPVLDGELEEYADYVPGATSESGTTE